MLELCALPQNKVQRRHLLAILHGAFLQKLRVGSYLAAALLCWGHHLVEVWGLSACPLERVPIFARVPKSCLKNSSSSKMFEGRKVLRHGGKRPERVRSGVFTKKGQSLAFPKMRIDPLRFCSSSGGGELFRDAPPKGSLSETARRRPSLRCESVTAPSLGRGRAEDCGNRGGMNLVRDRL